MPEQSPWMFGGGKALSLLLFVFCLLGCATELPAAEAEDVAAGLLSQAGFRGGFISHLGCGNGELTAALQSSPAVQVHGLTRDTAGLATARRRIEQTGRYGNVSADLLTTPQLPYVDNLVNLLVVEDSLGIPQSEIERVLVPNGVAVMKDAEGAWTKFTKPRTEQIDDWNHYFHDPSGNAVAHDDLVGPPRHLQWVGSPRWSRHHDRMASMSALVSEKGRLYYIMDEGSRISIQLPPQWKLIARDAFNGTVLWKRDIENWQTHLFPLKSGPTQLARRLVAVDDVLYVTLGYEAPLTAIDANTGETLFEFAGSGNCEEVIVSDGIIFLVANRNNLELIDYAPLNPVVGDQKTVADTRHWDQKPRVVMAYEAETGKQLWAKEGLVSPLTLSTDGRQVYFHDGESVTAVDRQTGDHLWTTEPASRRSIVTFNFGPRLVIHDGVVLYAGGDGKMAAYDATSGQQLWTASHPPSGYQSPQDLLVVGGLVWVAPTTSGRDSGIYTGRNLRTGEVVKEFPPDVETYWFHHRCYIAKATDNFLIPSRTGIEFVSPGDEHWDIHHWVRGGCLYGVLPCNGLLYAPPHNCACYPEAKLYGFNALAPRAPTRPLPAEVSEEGRREEGPAYTPEFAVSDNDATSHGWPTFRGSNERTGYTPARLDENLRPGWEAKLGGELTAPVVANGRVVVAQSDRHTVVALDEANGDVAWKFIAGGRVDSPPTIARGRVVFGSADGWVYCLNSQSGARSGGIGSLRRTGD
ncbi:MAG: PQQ-binding-like beta-propeller repeat protein [Planctomycetaceae bacterium]